MLTLNHESHTYHNSERPDIKYTSVSQLIGKYKNFFDAKAIAKFSAQKQTTLRGYSVTAQMLLKEWNDKKNLACDKGTHIHLQLENYFVENTIHLDIEKYIPELSKWKQEDVIFHPEMIIHSDEYKLAGCADMIIQRGDTYSIIDWKTNEKISKEGYNGQKMLGILSHLDDCNFIHYSLQMNMYAYLLKKPISKMTIIHLLDDGTINCIPCLDLKIEVIDILKNIIIK